MMHYGIMHLGIATQSVQILGAKSIQILGAKSIQILGAKYIKWNVDIHTCHRCVII